MAIFLKRVRHEIKKRVLNVQSLEYITPLMLRINFNSEDLGDFTSLSPDDHIKLFFETPNGIEMRDYTPRAFDNKNKSLTIDFAMHENGIATDWAKNAKIGDTLTIGGPRGSVIAEGTADWWLLMGDETAIPAIARRIEEMAKGTKAISLIAVSNEAEKQEFKTQADLQSFWIIRSENEKQNPEKFLEALENIELPKGDGFIWVAAEANVTRKIREYLFNIKNHPKNMVQAKGYWVKGHANSVEKFED